MSTPRLPDPTGAVPPEPGTLTAVINEARRRRVRRLGAFGGTGAAVVLAAVLATTLGGGAGSQTIGVTDGGDRDAVAAGADESRQPSPDCTTSSDPATGTTSTTCTPPQQTAVIDPTPARSTDPSADPSSAPGSSTPGSPPESAAPTPHPYPTVSSAPPRATPKPQPTRPSSPKPQPSSSSYPTPTPDPRPTDEPSQEARSGMSRTYVEGAVQCPDNAEWCAAATIPPAGRPVDLAVRACRDADAGPGQLETGPPGADFEVHDGNGMVWRWSSGQAFPAVMMSLDVDAGDCLEWKTTWKGVDDYNRPLPAGRYDGVATVTAEPVRTPMKFVITLT